MRSRTPFKLGRRLLEKRNAWAQWLADDHRFDAEGRNLATTYYRIVPKPFEDDLFGDPVKWIK